MVNPLLKNGEKIMSIKSFHIIMTLGIAVLSVTGVRAQLSSPFVLPAALPSVNSRGNTAAETRKSPDTTLAKSTDSVASAKQDADSVIHPYSYCKAQVSYLSNDIYNGRKPSQPIPYINTTLKYVNKSGFYISNGISYLVSSYAQRIDLYKIEVGYEKEIIDNLSVSVDAEKDYYNKNSASLSSSIEGYLNTNINYSTDIVDLNVGTSEIFTTTQALTSLNAGLSHEFSFNANQWTVEPAITANWGPRNYFNQYDVRGGQSALKKAAGSSTVVNGNVSVTTTTTVSLINPKQFVIIDYEMSLPIIYNKKKWGLFLTPMLAIPESPNTYSILEKSTTVNTQDGSSKTSTRKSYSYENLTNLFYFEAGVFIKF
jgi:hypothetical protein